MPRVHPSNRGVCNLQFGEQQLALRSNPAFLTAAHFVLRGSRTAFVLQNSRANNTLLPGIAYRTLAPHSATLRTLRGKPTREKRQKIPKPPKHESVFGQ